jgi:competence ComEA-like helix-hairpin-helix protein
MRHRRPHRLSTIQFAEVLLAGLVLYLAIARTVCEETEVPAVAAAEVTLHLDLNRAEWHELMYLPGIGEVRAREIVSDRARRGPFAGPESLARVKGIGPVTVRRIREYLGEYPGSEDGPADRREGPRDTR